MSHLLYPIIVGILQSIVLHFVFRNGEYAKLVHATIYAPAVTPCTHLFAGLNELSATLAYV